jgi:hypothetical protein
MTREGIERFRRMLPLVSRSAQRFPDSDCSINDEKASGHSQLSKLILRPFPRRFPAMSRFYSVSPFLIIFRLVPTPEQRDEYWRLSGLLQQICIQYKNELPRGTTSVLLINADHNVRLEAYDRSGRIGILPSKQTSVAFKNVLTEVFGSVTSPHPDGIAAPL